MGQFPFDPDAYLALMTSELPDYFRLQDEAAAPTGSGCSTLLELGTGTGETPLRVLDRHPGAAQPGLRLPRRVDDQLDWLSEAGLTASLASSRGDLAVVAAVRGV